MWLIPIWFEVAHTYVHSASRTQGSNPLARVSATVRPRKMGSTADPTDTHPRTLTSVPSTRRAPGAARARARPTTAFLSVPPMRGADPAREVVPAATAAAVTALPARPRRCRGACRPASSIETSILTAILAACRPADEPHTYVSSSPSTCGSHHAIAPAANGHPQTLGSAI